MDEVVRVTSLGCQGSKVAVIEITGRPHLPIFIISRSYSPEPSPHLEVTGFRDATSVARLLRSRQPISATFVADEGEGFCWSRYMAWCEKVRQAQAQLVDNHIDPWKRVLERSVPANVAAISTVALLDLLDVPPTTGNARRLAHSMRALGWVGLKSRRLAPGGWRTTTCRGWTRAALETNQSSHGKLLFASCGERIET